MENQTILQLFLLVRQRGTQWSEIARAKHYNDHPIASTTLYTEYCAPFGNMVNAQSGVKKLRDLVLMPKNYGHL